MEKVRSGFIAAYRCLKQAVFIGFSDFFFGFFWEKNTFIVKSAVKIFSRFYTIIVKSAVKFFSRFCNVLEHIVHTSIAPAPF